MHGRVGGTNTACNVSSRSVISTACLHMFKYLIIQICSLTFRSRILDNCRSTSCLFALACYCRSMILPVKNQKKTVLSRATILSLFPIKFMVLKRSYKAESLCDYSCSANNRLRFICCYFKAWNMTSDMLVMYRYNRKWVRWWVGVQLEERGAFSLVSESCWIFCDSSKKCTGKVKIDYT